MGDSRIARHLHFLNPYELALGVLVMPFGPPLKTGGIYALCLQPAAASHAACAVVMQWFAAQVEKTLQLANCCRYASKLSIFSSSLSPQKIIRVPGTTPFGSFRYAVSVSRSQVLPEFFIASEYT